MRSPQKVARIFKALSSDARVRILQMLKARSLCVGALAARLDVSSAAVSQHLRILRDAGLVVPDKRGYYVHYRLNRKTLEQWRQVAEDLLGPDDR
jgi:DNA-binding transcriptional ArsR family regulator